MYNITICIPTYKRPEMLKKLVQSIVENNINKTLIKEVNIIVADNDAEKTAESLINELKKKI
jgi:glycosyltransferase involved in cell wall biosynthesis